MQLPKYQPFFDLLETYKRDIAFKQTVTRCQGAIDEAYRSGNSYEAKKACLNMLRECKFNPSFLLSFCFPNFQDGKPMTLWSRPHAFAMMAFVPNGSITIAASRQIGKCVAGDTEVEVCIGEETPKKTSCKELFSMARKKIACTGESK